MNPLSECWIIVADASQVRVLEERRRHDDLTELAEWAMTSDAGDASNTHNAALKAQAEKRFMDDLGARLDKAAKAHKFEHLAVIAPAKLLGMLRDALGTTARLVEVSDPHERVQETPAQIKRRLHELRVPA